MECLNVANGVFQTVYERAGTKVSRHVVGSMSACFDMPNRWLPAVQKALSDVSPEFPCRIWSYDKKARDPNCSNLWQEQQVTTTQAVNVEIYLSFSQ